MAEKENAITVLAAERVAKAARLFCEELQEDAEGVPQLQLAELNAALDAWEAYPDARESFDDSQPVEAALVSLIEDEHATDHQRRVAHLALTAIQNHEDELDKELRRWQDAIRDKLIDLGAPDWKIDGAGCDSGDPLDFTLAEVGQGVGYFVDQLESFTWQPIETAPVDQSVLIFIPNPLAEHYGPAIYRGLCVHNYGGSRVWKVFGLHSGRDCGAGYWPTHWMPLPDPPEVKD